MFIEKPILVHTGHFTNKTIMINFAQGLGQKTVYHIDNFKNFDVSVASYGFLRGAGELYQKVKDFWYLDHGYLKLSDRKFRDNKIIYTQNENFNGYFRIVHNNYWHDGSINFPSDRFEKLKLDIIPQKNNGQYIILSEPTPLAVKFHRLENWVDRTISEIKKYSDRKIIIHSRGSKIPLINLLENAWAFVSDHSSAGFISMLNGIPAFFTNPQLQSIGKIEDIERHKINERFFANFAYCQWTLDEIKSGEAWSFISHNLY